MQLYIKSSNSLELLVDKLTRVIQSNDDPDVPPLISSTGPVFTPIYIVTQTDGMQAWLKMRLAEKTGIAANLIFMKPNELINIVYKVTDGKFENTLSVADIQWLIFKALSNEDITTKYPSLVNYYFEMGRLDNVKRMGLSQKLADLFDQYEVYRPDMLKGWENGKLTTHVAEEKWQMDIWNIIRTEAGKKFPDKSRIKETILQNLSDENISNRLQTRIPAVHFFGTSLITSFHFDILQSISEYIPISFYLPNPAPHLYWYEDKSKKALFYQRRKGIHTDDTLITNPLLINWGKLVQNTFRLLFSSDEVINLYQDIQQQYDDRTLLSSVQHLIHENSVVNPAGRFSEAVLKDNSITIKSCFSVAREVEALYNFLVKLIDDNPGKYSPRDIVVHVTNINRYSSYIRSVFDNAPHPLRYSIADESFAAADTISQALYEILALEENDFTSEKVVQLLNFSSIRRHFNITDIRAIRDVVAEANIRHGIDGDLQSESVYVSWSYGLKRIMYGICMSTDEEYQPGEKGFFPLNSIEGNEANEIIHFVYFVEKLIHLLRNRKDGRTVNRWIEYIHDALRHLIFDEEERDNPEYQQLTEHLNSMTAEEELFNEPISWQVFLRQFLPGLNEMAQSYQFARGGITFCSLIPMRSIPFKIVAMLGLDFDKFPRKPITTGFDLMHKCPRSGDRDIKINDKHLFLETIMSAGDCLYLSYIGQRIKDNSKLPPSILVDEFISFVEASSEQPEIARRLLLKEEPLHGFSPRYGNESGYHNYLLGTANPVKIQYETEKEGTKMDAFDLLDFQRFLSDSVSWYYKNIIGIFLDDESMALPEREMFEMDNLQRWGLKNSLLMANESDIPSIVNHQKKTGGIPLKSSGEYEVETILEDMEKVKLLFEEERGGLEPKAENIEIEIEDIKITAGINFVFGNKVLLPCFSKNENKYLLQSWLTEIVLSAANKEYTVIFIGNKKRVASKIPANAAVALLKQLIFLMIETRNQLFPFNIKWFPFEKQPGAEGQLQKKIDKEAEKDNYLALAMKDGLPGNMLELYERIANLVIPSILKTFKPEAAE